PPQMACRMRGRAVAGPYFHVVVSMRERNPLARGAIGPYALDRWQSDWRERNPPDPAVAHCPARLLLHATSLAAAARRDFPRIPTRQRGISHPEPNLRSQYGRSPASAGGATMRPVPRARARRRVAWRA